MKRISNSDPQGALISICPSTDEDQEYKGVYSREFQSMLDGYEEEETCIYEESGAGRVAEKKRRLSVDQVKALEKNFEVENKLEPERKVKLAQELGLQPRQVAVWFQNRRARWKTKTLERDYGYLKANYDSLKLSFESLQSDNQALIKEIKKLKSKLNEDENPEKEEALDSESNEPDPETEQAITITKTEQASMEFKDAGPSDSDSSAILSPKAEVLAPANSQSFNGFEFFNLQGSTESSRVSVAAVNAFQSEYVKMEEHNFFSEEAPCCNFFTEDQAPTLHWYTPESWT